VGDHEDLLDRPAREVAGEQLLAQRVDVLGGDLADRRVGAEVRG